MRLLSAIALTVAAALALVPSCESTNGEPVPLPNVDAGESRAPTSDGYMPHSDVFEPSDTSYFPDAQYDGATGVSDALP